MADALQSMAEAYHTLGVAEGCELTEAKHAYLMLRDIYAHDSLAIYSLLTEEERERRMDRVEEAFRRIKDHATVEIPSAPVAEPAVTPGDMPDPEVETGAYLHWMREQTGLSIRQLAERTKISSLTLEDIERDRYGHLPPTVYVRGFVREVARILGIANACEIADYYLKHLPPEPVD
jgi:hypothetical protein